MPASRQLKTGLIALAIFAVGIYVGVLSSSHLSQQSTSADVLPKARAARDLRQTGQIDSDTALKAIEALLQLQQRQQSDAQDDDGLVDAVADALMKESVGQRSRITKTGEAKMQPLDLQVQVKHPSPPAPKPVMPGPQRKSDGKSVSVVGGNDRMDQLVAQLGLNKMLNDAPVAKNSSGIKPRTTTKLPDYLQNTMKDEPPYGTPPDKNPKLDPKVYCFVLTIEKRHDTKAVAVNNTWGRRFDGLNFMTSAPFPGLDTVVLNIKDESRKTLWPKIKLAWLHTYANYIDKYDWFMKADDDTFVMVDNLRRMLKQYDPNKPHFFGKQFLLHRGQPKIELRYMSGGAGYVLSRGALKLLGDNAKTALSNNGIAEDVEIARSLLKLGIVCDDTRDEEGRERFIPMNIDNMRYKYTHKNKPYFWYWRYSYYPTRDGYGCCSKYWISTHYMYSMDLYRLEKLYIEGKDGHGKDPKPEDRVNPPK
eukprot:TRINITY_DN9080_c0_g1_i2.p1 TRINITY_DN9080_c0_g1~~TRINITY_DN9080_c0_g1_i2.p1  ORF type:complete len:478 (+),score=104.21 TRINITY_DN9080_c0_g1_i2:124-1557(+)